MLGTYRTLCDDQFAFPSIATARTGKEEKNHWKPTHAMFFDTSDLFLCPFTTWICAPWSVVYISSAFISNSCFTPSNFRPLMRWETMRSKIPKFWTIEIFSFVTICLCLYLCLPFLRSVNFDFSFPYSLTLFFIIQKHTKQIFLVIFILNFKRLK